MIGRTLRKGAQIAFHRLGGLQMVRRRNRRAVRILMYHRFPATQMREFERQCAHIRRHYVPLSMPRLVELLRSGEPLPKNAVVLTVDDGHRDFLLNAMPVLRRYGLPATVYLISGFVDGELWPWFDRVLWIFANTPLRALDLALGDRRLTLDLTDPEAGQHVASAMADLSAEAHARVLDELPGRLRVKVPAVAPTEYASLSWEDARTLAREQIDFGGHTVTHPILARVADTQQLAWEVTHSKARIEQELGREAVSFCYPNGRLRDVTDAGVEAVKRAGYQVAVLARGGLNRSWDDRFRLRRVPCGVDLPNDYFRQILAGFRDNQDGALC